LIGEVDGNDGCFGAIYAKHYHFILSCGHFVDTRSSEEGNAGPGRHNISQHSARRYLGVVGMSVLAKQNIILEAGGLCV
jgi:hypothetical protein